MADSTGTSTEPDPHSYSLADQAARVARAQQQHHTRFLNIDSVYNPSVLQNQRIAVTGANRGLGLALATAVAQVPGAQLVALVRSSSPELQALQPQQIITGMDVTNDETCAKIGEKITGGPIDIVSGWLLYRSYNKQSS